MENDKAFDDFIRLGMENHPLPDDNGDWDKMESILFADEQLQDAEFDDFLRDGVEKASPQLPNSDWGLMEAMIVSEELFSSEVFDEQILEDVRQVEIPTPQGNWGLMESMLVADELILNQEFDSSIKEELKNIDTTTPSNWGKMEAMLEKEDQHGRELLYAKTIELALIVLAVVMLFRFFPSNNNMVEASFPSGATAELKENIVNQDNNNNTIGNRDKNEKVNSATQNIIVPTNTTNGNTIDNKNSNNLVASERTNNNSIKNKINTDKNQRSTTYHISQDTRVKNSSSTSNVPVNTLSSDNSLTEKNEIISENIPFSHENPTQIKTDIDKDSPSFLLSELLAKSSEEVVSEKKKEKDFLHAEAAPKFRIGTYISANRNHVMSPYDEKAEVSFEQNTYGVTAGAEATIAKHNTEFSAGIAYTRMKYLPKTVLEITGNTARGYEAEKLDLMSYHIVSVPLNMRYYFSKYASWRFYAKTGVTMNSIFANTNHINQYTLPSFRDLDALLAEGPESIRKDKQGFLNGQSLGDSFFLKANLGVGVERRFAKRYHVFVEPNFNYHIYSVGNGFGPNKDRINHISLDMGVRMNF